MSILSDYCIEYEIKKKIILIIRIVLQGIGLYSYKILQLKLRVIVKVYLIFDSYLNEQY